MSVTSRQMKKQAQKREMPQSIVLLGDGFDQPSTDVTDIDAAFGARALEFMPAYDAIPDDFRRGRGDARAWTEFQGEWFFRGISKNAVIARDDIDADAAWRHLKMIQGSFAPKHEHKEAAVAGLAYRWFSMRTGR